MIKIVLKVNEYCHNCPIFEPKMDRLRYESVDGVTDEVSIRCNHEENCGVLKRFFCEYNVNIGECCELCGKK